MHGECSPSPCIRFELVRGKGESLALPRNDLLTGLASIALNQFEWNEFDRLVLDESFVVESRGGAGNLSRSFDQTEERKNKKKKEKYPFTFSIRPVTHSLITNKSMFFNETTTKR